jgi:predicted Fe-S protein YdhL (DUF1289 family)
MCGVVATAVSRLGSSLRGAAPASLARDRRALYLRTVGRAKSVAHRRPSKSETHRMSVKIASPCIGVCTLDPASRTCVGCLRTADEIERWPSMSPVEQVQVVLQLRIRRHAHGIGDVADARQRRRARKLAQLVS